MIFELSLGLGAGLALGWFLRGARQGSSAALIDEMYGRKLRLAESDREQAVRTLNENRLEMATFDERFATLDAEIERLLHELENVLQARAAADKELGRRAEQISGLEEEIARARSFANEALQESAEATRERDQEVATADAARAALSQRDLEVFELAVRVRERVDENAVLARGLAERDAHLEEARSARVATAHELEHTRGALERAQAELMRLAALEPEFADARAGLAERDGALVEREATIVALSARVAELEPFVARLGEAQSDLVAWREVSAVREGELDRTWRERHESELAAKAREIERLLARMAALELIENEAHGLRARAAELEPLPARLERENERAEKLVRTLADERTAAVALAERLRAQAEQLEAAQREQVSLAQQLAKANERIAGLEQKVERGIDKQRELSERLTARAAELDAARDGHADMAKQLATLGASHRAKQLELDRRNVKYAELERAVTERDGRIAKLIGEQRDLAIELRVLAAAAKRANSERNGAPGADRDDLQRIAGIGPALEKKLRRMGLTTFRQLATLSKEDLDRVADKLGLSAERIRREGWIAAARGELRAKGA